jgi:cobalt/nickel transport system permease protein
MGAFVFAAQMINFPVGAATSGHLVGSALLTYTLGPASASILMTAILAVQALVFQDGGLLALGANVFNMAVAGVAAAYLPYALFGAGRFRSLAVFSGGLLSVLVGASLALVQLAASGIAMAPPVLGVSAIVFLISGLVEGGITVAVVNALERFNPGWLQAPKPSGRRALKLVACSAVLLAALGVLVASSEPDGLERTMERLGVAEHARTLFETPLADYETSGLDAPWLRKASAGLAGLALIYAVCAGLGALVTRQRSG